MNLFNIFDKKTDSKELWRETFGSAYYQNKDYEGALNHALEAADKVVDAYEAKFS